MKTETPQSNPPAASVCPAPERWEAYLQTTGRRAPDPELESHLLECDPCLAEAGRLLADQPAARRTNRRHAGERAGDRPETRPAAFFAMTGGLIVRVRGLFSRPGPVFRSGTRTVIHSDIIPLAADYIILELFNDGERTRLNLEKGAKNGSPINISLYINERLSDNLQLQRSHSWDLGQFPRGSYSLHLEAKTVLKFELRE